ncbi:amp dependent CoA ligase [Trametes versicolor FP-101664 SS1]|uniref:amp dependent CoA ligase n=1 Tax=Trametes versicolor (strain FP-101664) TaxID=717944 RepID=UPI0004622A3B|nr:amp dependent CoA ligase [Trametes versicolor FP-101664 SS1]EIW53371.1 amp dependent CoA ligase [Trametes versicolor FP-101664 SS1]
MAEIHADGGPLPPIPDDLTIPQFLLDSHHPARPVLKKPQPWLIEEATGREVGSDELRARTFGLANALKLRWNINEDDVVCIFGQNHIDYPVAIWAVHRLGAVVTGANPAYTADELLYQLTATKARVLIAHPGSLSVALEAARGAGIPTERVVVFDAIPGASNTTVHELIAEGLDHTQQFFERKLQPGEGKRKLAFLSFSSGTTGRPKAVMIPHYAVLANVIQLAHWTKAKDESRPLDLQRHKPGSRNLAVLPFYHIYGLVVVLHFNCFIGTTLVVVQKFNFEQFLDSIQRYRITNLCLVPPMIVLLCKHPAVAKYDLSSLRMLMSGAAPLTAELMTQLMARLPNCWIGQAYGMTETCTAVTFPQVDQPTGTLGSGGFLLPGCTARVVKPDGSLAALGEAGELVVTSPSVAIGYMNNAQATAETFKDGWVSTGDEVYFNERKEIFVVDRIKELIKVRGYQVPPAELEGHLLGHPDVGDVCVVGIPDEYSGELPLAFIVPSADAQARMDAGPRGQDDVRKAILKHVADHKTSYKHLVGLEFIDVIPKNPSGKLLRRFLRDRAKELRASGKLVLNVRAKL